MKEYALVTGASKGIGRAIALELAGAGYNLLLIARSEPELQGLSEIIKKQYNADALYMAIDLSNSSAISAVYDWCSRLNMPISILVNNAGFGIWGRFEDLDRQEQMRMLNLNIHAVVELTYCLIPLLRTQKSAFIMNVSSTAAYQSVPTLTLYAASKAFVLPFSRGLRYELKGSGISVSCLCPGPTDTGFAHSAGMDALADLAAKFNMKADDVAKIALKGLFNKKTEIIPGFLNKLSAFGARHLNKSLIERISGKLYQQ
jgi:short-subunit dehydrogenase